MKITPASILAPFQQPDSSFSEDFQQWLKANGYGDYAFAQPDAQGIGGKATPSEPRTRQPVIFIHGNSDDARGWQKSMEAFKKAGYRPGELFAMTWGPATPLLASMQTHSPEYLKEVRAFIEAVKAYTGAEKVDVIGHSMGVTLARKAIQGGPVVASDPAVNLGKPLTDSVDTFVGIAGGNRGLRAAALPIVPTANPVDGFFPELATPVGDTPASDFLEDINAHPHQEGEHVFSIWSRADPIARGAPGVEPTARIPGQDGERVYSVLGHMTSRDLSGEVQVQMVKDHES